MAYKLWIIKSRKGRDSGFHGSCSNGRTRRRRGDTARARRDDGRSAGAGGGRPVEEVSAEAEGPLHVHARRHLSGVEIARADPHPHRTRLGPLSRRRHNACTPRRKIRSASAVCRGHDRSSPRLNAPRHRQPPPERPLPGSAPLRPSRPQSRTARRQRLAEPPALFVSRAQATQLTKPPENIPSPRPRAASMHHRAHPALPLASSSASPSASSSRSTTNVFNPKILDASIRDVTSYLSDEQKADVLLYAMGHLHLDRSVPALTLRRVSSNP